MPGKKKKFIDKKNAVTFHLVHRSQRDPLQADEDAPQRVLLPAEPLNEKDAISFRKKEEQKYGVFYDDDYDYMQHLKEVNELYEVGVSDYSSSRSKKSGVSVLKLPSSVFGSHVETDVGLLNKAAPLKGPQLDWDPDIVAALDEDFDFDNPDNLLEDDFIAQANAEKMTPDGDLEDEEEDDIASDEAEQMSDAGSDFGSFGDQSFAEMETKSRFTNYSITSSVIRRNEGLTLLDDRFEKIYEQYDDEEIGALDHEEIRGYVDQGSHLLNSVMEDFEKQQQQMELEENSKEPSNGTEDESGDDDSEVEGNEELVKVVVEEPKEKWDCESILSTYSNLYNHPKTIEEPRKSVKPITLTRRAEIPKDVLPPKGPTRKQLEQVNHVGDAEPFSAVTYRPKDETLEEKKARKSAIKEERKNRRLEKKANKIAFKAEEIQQKKELINVQKNLKGVKIV